MYDNDIKDNAMEINSTNPIVRSANYTQSVNGTSSVSQTSADTPGNLETSSPVLSQSSPGTLNEISPSQSLLPSSPSSDLQFSVLKEDAGSGNLNVKIATAIYALNHSFDEQKAVLDLIA